jgi:methyl-accepting chemotaxis protein
VFLLAASFIGALLVVSAIGWLTQRDLGHVINRSNAVIHESEVLFDIMEAIDHGTTAMLLFVVDPANPWEDFPGSIDSALEHVALAEVTFSADTPTNRQVREKLTVIKAHLEEIPAFYEAAESEAMFGQVDTVNSDLLPRLRAVEKEAEAVLDILSAKVTLVQNAAAASAAKANMVTLAANSVVALLCVVLAFFFGRMLSQPILRARDAIGALVAQDFAGEVPDRDRRDEVGAMARGLDDLRGRLGKAQAAEAALKLENARRIDLFQTLGIAMNQLRGGELDRRIEAGEWRDLGESYVKLCRDFNELASALESLVSSLRQSTETVQANAGELSSMSDDMSRRAEVQAATLEQSSAALDQLAASVKTAAEKARIADEKVVEGRRRAEQGGIVMAKALDAMSSIAKSSEQISQIIGVIDDIAFQTNLLALNAGVEAARAGESGKGFSVVASEVRGLAQRASASAGEIKDLVLGSVEQVEDGEKLVQETSQTLNHIVESVTEVSGMVADIAASAQTQASGVQEINIGIAELDKVTQQNAAMVGETSAASQQLTVEATRLSDLLSRFSNSPLAVASEPTGVAGVPELFFDLPELPPAKPKGETASPRDESTMVTADGSKPDPVGERLDREKLVQGSWSAEYPDPDPVPAPIKDELRAASQTPKRETPKPPPVPSAPAKRAANDNADVWLDF